MKTTKINFFTNKYCHWIVCFFIFSGCSSHSKRQEISSLQKLRIHQLEKQLSEKQQLIDKLKASQWVNEPVVLSESLAFRPLKKAIKNKNWVRALNVSHSLKKQYPDSVQLSRLRIKVLKAMGLRQPLANEVQNYRQLRAQRQQKRF